MRASKNPSYVPVIHGKDYAMSQSDLLRAVRTSVCRGNCGRVDRRSLLRRVTAAGLALPTAGAFAGLSSTRASATVARQDNVSTLTIAMNGSPSDLDPHSVYDYRSAMPLRGPYESLIALDG